MKYLELTIGAILVYNFVLARFLGICPFLGVSKRLGTAMGMSGAVVFVMTIASFITSLIYRYLLKFEIDGTPYDLSFLQVLLFILVIAGLVQLIEIMLQKLSPKLYQALGIYLPLITTNCAVTAITRCRRRRCSASAPASALRWRCCFSRACANGSTSPKFRNRSREPRSPSSPPESWRWRSSASRDSADGVAT